MIDFTLSSEELNKVITNFVYILSNEYKNIDIESDRAYSFANGIFYIRSGEYLVTAKKLVGISYDVDNSYSIFFEHVTIEEVNSNDFIYKTVNKVSFLSGNEKISIRKNNYQDHGSGSVEYRIVSPYIADILFLLKNYILNYNVEYPRLNNPYINIIEVDDGYDYEFRINSHLVSLIVNKDTKCEILDYTIVDLLLLKFEDINIRLFEDAEMISFDIFKGDVLKTIFTIKADNPYYKIVRMLINKMGRIML